MRRLFHNKLLTVVIVLCIIFITFIGFTASQRDRVSILEGVIGNILSPVQKYLYMGGQRVNNFFGFITSISTISRENEALKNKNIELENKLIEYESIKAQNERLKEALDFKNQNVKYSYVGANVTGKGSGNWFDTFVIDKGSNQGVKRFYPVVTGRGLVGQVMEVGPNWAKVLCIVDEQSKVSGTIIRTGVQGMIQGTSAINGDKNCRMMYLPADSDIQKGDIVVTSGLSKFFPGNIKIGVVEEVSGEKTEFVKTAVIRPDVDFTRIEEVLVITNAFTDEDYPAEEN